MRLLLLILTLVLSASVLYAIYYTLVVYPQPAHTCEMSYYHLRHHLVEVSRTRNYSYNYNETVASINGMPIKASLLNPPASYKLYRYVDNRRPIETTRPPIPLLFLPGNAGSFHQFRSLASRMDIIEKGSQRFAYYSVDFGEEHSAWNGALLYREAAFVNDCIHTILKHIRGIPNQHSRKNNPERVILIAHSIGGIVARLLSTMPNFVAGSIRGLYTLGTPHNRPVYCMDDYMTVVYNAIRPIPIDIPFVISIAGGMRDYFIEPKLTTLLHHPLNLSGNSLPFLYSTTTLAIPGVLREVDHQALCWCKQLMITLASAIIDLPKFPSKKDKTTQLRWFQSNAHNFFVGLHEELYTNMINLQTDDPHLPSIIPVTCSVRWFATIDREQITASEIKWSLPHGCDIIFVLHIPIEYFNRIEICDESSSRCESIGSQILDVSSTYSTSVPVYLLRIPASSIAPNALLVFSVVSTVHKFLSNSVTPQESLLYACNVIHPDIKSVSGSIPFSAALGHSMSDIRINLLSESSCLQHWYSFASPNIDYRHQLRIPFPVNLSASSLQLNSDDEPSKSGIGLVTAPILLHATSFDLDSENEIMKSSTNTSTFTFDDQYYNISFLPSHREPLPAIHHYRHDRYRLVSLIRLSPPNFLQSIFHQNLSEIARNVVSTKINITRDWKQTFLYYFPFFPISFLRTLYLLLPQFPLILSFFLFILVLCQYKVYWYSHQWKYLPITPFHSAISVIAVYYFISTDIRHIEHFLAKSISVSPLFTTPDNNNYFLPNIFSIPFLFNYLLHHFDVALLLLTLIYIALTYACLCMLSYITLILSFLIYAPWFCLVKLCRSILCFLHPVRILSLTLTPPILVYFLQSCHLAMVFGCLIICIIFIQFLLLPILPVILEWMPSLTFRFFLINALPSFHVPISIIFLISLGISLFGLSSSVMNSNSNTLDSIRLRAGNSLYQYRRTLCLGSLVQLIFVIPEFIGQFFFVTEPRTLSALLHSLFPRISGPSLSNPLDNGSDMIYIFPNAFVHFYSQRSVDAIFWSIILLLCSWDLPRISSANLFTYSVNVLFLPWMNLVDMVKRVFMVTTRGGVSPIEQGHLKIS